MCTMGVSGSSCGSLEAIAQVSIPNTAVLATRRDALRYTTWSIFSFVFFFRMLSFELKFVLSVRPNIICRSFDNLRFNLRLLITLQLRLNTEEVSFLVQYVTFMESCTYYLLHLHENIQGPHSPNILTLSQTERVCRRQF